jgi:hypothetical protein
MAYPPLRGQARASISTPARVQPEPAQRRRSHVDQLQVLPFVVSGQLRPGRFLTPWETISRREFV